nr:Flp pilus assembly protein CpaB [Pseudarthrobacter sulfonivorans]
MPWLSRNRRLAIALLLCIAAGITVHQLTPPPADTATTLAAARDLPAGTALAAADLAPVKIPPQLVNAGSVTDPREATGKQLAAPLRKGQLLTDSQLLGPGLLAGAPPGSAAVPLRMADPSSIQLVSPGQLVNVVLTGANGYDQNSPSQVLASSVPVLWTSGQGGKTGQWLGTGETDGLIVVAAAPEQAARLAGASTQGKLFFVLVGPPSPAG